MPPVTPSMLVVFGLVIAALVLFYTEPLPIDVTAILIIVLNAILEPWTGISPQESISGFSNPATITVMAMLFLAEAIRETGVIQRIGSWLSNFAGESKSRQVISTLGVGGLPAGFVNNTPVVAMLVPVVSEMARRGRQSPSKLLIPLSYAAQMGGMLTLIGTSTNLLASDLSARLLDHRIWMFEFTALGVIVLVTGSLFLFWFSDSLLPDRIDPDESDLERYHADEYLTEITIGPDNEYLGLSIGEFVDTLPWEFSPILLERDGEPIDPPIEHIELEAGDMLVLRASPQVLNNLLAEPGFESGRSTDAEGASIGDDHDRRMITEVVVTRGAPLTGDTLRRSEFLETFGAQILAIQSQGQLLHTDLRDYELHPGDVLLIATSEANLERLRRRRDIVLSQRIENPRYRPEKIPFVIGVMGVVVTLPALGVLPIVTTGLGGMVAMVMGGVIRFADVYDRIHWDVIFLLAGVIPLGQALERSGGADLLGSLVAQAGEVLPALVVLWIFYMATSLITEVISNNASVVLMIPVGIETANQIGAEPFAFVLAVTFAASTAFLTPIGYQTNLFVYGPGGYQFTDYTKVGAPLLALLSVISVTGIYAIWGL